MKKLGEILIEKKLLDENQLEAALAYQGNWGGRLGHAIAELNFVEEFEIAMAISQSINIPYVNIFSEDFSDKELKKFEESLVRKYSIIPIKRKGNTLEVAMSDPTDLDVMNDIQFATGYNIKPLLALETEIQAFITQYYSGGGVVHRKSIKRAFPTKFEVVHQKCISEEDASIYQALRKIKSLTLLLVEKGILTSEEVTRIID